MLFKVNLKSVSRQSTVQSVNFITQPGICHISHSHVDGLGQTISAVFKLDAVFLKDLFSNYFANKCPVL